LSHRDVDALASIFEWGPSSFQFQVVRGFDRRFFPGSRAAAGLGVLRVYFGRTTDDSGFPAFSLQQD
jgi:hypothetical protein